MPLLVFRFHTPPLATHPLPCSVALCQVVPHLSGSLMPRGASLPGSVLHHDGPGPVSAAGGTRPQAWASAQEWCPAPRPSWVTVRGAAWLQVKGFCSPCEGPPGLWLSFSCVTFSKSLSISAPLVGKKDAEDQGQQLRHSAGTSGDPPAGGVAGGGRCCEESRCLAPSPGGWPPPLLSFSMLSCRGCSLGPLLAGLWGSNKTFGVKWPCIKL